MRAAELGIDVVHAAVTGKSTFITEGGVVGETLGLAESDILYGSPRLRTSGPTLYARLGDWMVVLAALAGAVAVLARRPARPQTP
jgi:apolipoprotein N-acyltransferase